nr:cullin, conserved site-containing protein [Tanacetum cinerariifolium]
TPRLRIKVSSDKPVRKNDEIYNGPGLLLSPSSSTGNNSEDIADRILGIKVALPVNQFVGRNATTVNGQPRPKKMKTNAELYQHEHLFLTKIKNEYETQMENTRASSKSKERKRKMRLKITKMC